MSARLSGTGFPSSNISMCYARRSRCQPQLSPSPQRSHLTRPFTIIFLPNLQCEFDLKSQLRLLNTLSTPLSNASPLLCCSCSKVLRIFSFAERRNVLFFLVSVPLVAGLSIHEWVRPRHFHQAVPDLSVNITGNGVHCRFSFLLKSVSATKVLHHSPV